MMRKIATAHDGFVRPGDVTTWPDEPRSDFMSIV